MEDGSEVLDMEQGRAACSTRVKYNPDTWTLDPDQVTCKRCLQKVPVEPSVDDDTPDVEEKVDKPTTAPEPYEAPEKEETPVDKDINQKLDPVIKPTVMTQDKLRRNLVLDVPQPKVKVRRAHKNGRRGRGHINRRRFLRHPEKG
jgi:hypothetical protein